MCGVKTNVVTAVEITDRFAGDSPLFKPLVDATAQNFVMQEVSADKAYLSAANLQTVVDHAAMPYIPFKSNSASDGVLRERRTRQKSELATQERPLAADVSLLRIQPELVHAAIPQAEQRRIHVSA